MDNYFAFIVWKLEKRAYLYILNERKMKSFKKIHIASSNEMTIDELYRINCLISPLIAVKSETHSNCCIVDVMKHNDDQFHLVNICNDFGLAAFDGNPDNEEYLTEIL